MLLSQQHIMSRHAILAKPLAERWARIWWRQSKGVTMCSAVKMSHSDTVVGPGWPIARRQILVVSRHGSKLEDMT